MGWTVSPNSSEWASGQGFEVYNSADPEAGARLFKTEAEATHYAAQKNESERRELIREKHEWDNRMGDE